MKSLATVALTLISLASIANAAAPEIQDIAGNAVSSGTASVALQVPVGKTLVLSVATNDSDGDALGYSVSSSNPAIAVRARNGYSSLVLSSTFTVLSGTVGVPASGTMELLLFRDFTPNTSGLIGGLAQSGFYDSVLFHRVIEGFVLQGGDPLSKDGNPNNDGTGGPGFTFENEFDPALIFTGTGQFAMANSGFAGNFEATNGSQFFITLGSPRGLDFNHTIFGQIVRGYDVMESIGDVLTNPSTGRPINPVEIVNAQVVPNKTDACLFITATGTGSSTVTVTANDGTSSSTPVTFEIQAVADTTNDPPFLRPVTDGVATRLRRLKLNLDGIDLEQDPLVFAAAQLDDPPRASVRGGGLSDLFKIRPAPKKFKGPAHLGFGVRQLLESTRGSTNHPWDLQTTTVGMNDKAITADSELITGGTGQALTNVTVAQFTDADPNGTAQEYSATINWGDGVLSGTSSVSVTKTGSAFLVSSSHTYSKPGTYPVRVTISGLKGVTADVWSSAVITADDFSISSPGLSVSGTAAFSTQVASFTDASPSAYTAKIQWGDGTVSNGTVQPSGGSFSVTGSHQYAETGTYPLSVEVLESGTSHVAWSTAIVSDANRNIFPPFDQGRLSGVWMKAGQSVKGGVTFFTGTIVIVNSGSLPVTGGTVSFYHSTDTDFTPGPDALLNIAGGGTGIALPTIAPGAQYVLKLKKTDTHDRRVVLSIGTAGEYIFAKVDYSDPIGNTLPLRKEWPVTIPAP